MKLCLLAPVSWTRDIGELGALPAWGSPVQAQRGANVVRDEG